MNETNAKQTSVAQVLQVLNELAPPELAESWDPIGLQVGDPMQPALRTLLVLDVTFPLIKKAAAVGCNLIISHHPLIFTPLPAVRADQPEQRIVHELIKNSISVIAAHTNLDAAPGGVADCLADALQLARSSRQTIATYGRAVDLPRAESLRHLLQRTSQQLGSFGCRINTDQDRPVKRLAVFPGSFSEEWISELAARDVDALICGELKYHLGLMLAARGIAAISAGHDVTERVVLRPLVARLSDRLPQISFAVSDGLDYNKMAF